MRSLLLILSCLTLCIVSCKKTKCPSPGFDGTYKGTFQRLPGGGLAQVTLTFASGNWSGVSDTRNYPALCKGTYTLSTDSINFANQCVFTADFDGTLILHGGYKKVQHGDSLILTRNVSVHSAQNVYKLKKQ